MSGCCGSAAGGRNRLQPFECFQRGLHTRRKPPLQLAGPRCSLPDGRWASFSLRLQAGRLEEIRFQSTSCTTLVACCEALAERNCGCHPDRLELADAAALHRAMPGIPVHKQACAQLAVQALQKALQGQTVSIVKPEEAHT